MDQEKRWESRRPVSSPAVQGQRRMSRLNFSEVRKSIYGAAVVAGSLVTGDPRYDPDQYHDDFPILTRQSTRESQQLRRSRHAQQQPHASNPFDDSYQFDGISAGQTNIVNPFDDSNAVQQLQVSPDPPTPYHVFPKQKKRLLIGIIGAAGLFSGLSSNIFFPSLDAIAKDLNVSLATVSLTITSYLIIQGISPLFWGSLSDTVGRRPIYLASFAVYIIANIALSFSPNFAVLLIFRGLQAAGSASTVSIGNGVIQDISPPSERGAYISFYQAIRNFSIAVGPVLGGIFANFLGFRSIFIFLVVISTLTTIMIIVLLPETLRSIAGNGSLRLSGIYRPLIDRVRKEPPYMEDPDQPIERKKVTLMTFIDPLKLLAEKDILLNLVFGGVVYAIWSMVTSSTTGLFKSRFGLNELLLGLAFLPNGLGTIVGSTIVGKLMTRDFKTAETLYRTTNNLPSTYTLPAKNLPASFPIEHARLRQLPWIVGLFAVSTAAYGLSLSGNPAVTTALPGFIALPLALQFIIAATSNAVFALNQTLVTDLCPGKGASSTAVNNLVRCGVGALGVALVENMISALGVTPTFLGLALLTVCMVPLAVVNWYWGQKWRGERLERKARLEAEKNGIQKA